TVVEYAAGTEIERAGDPGEAFRPPPLLEAFELAMRLPREIARRVEHTGDHEGARCAGARAGQVPFEAIGGRFGAFHRAILRWDATAFLRGREHRAHGDQGLVVLGRERHRGVKADGFQILVATMPVDQALRPHDFEVGDLVLIVAAVRSVHDEAPHTAGLHLSLGGRGGEATPPPPLHDLRWFGPGVEYALRRRIDEARGDDLAVGGTLRVSGHGVHASSPSSALLEPRAGNFPNGRAVRPTARGIARARHRHPSAPLARCGTVAAAPH